MGRAKPVVIQLLSEPCFPVYGQYQKAKAEAPWGKIVELD
jgi:hypothetical protein